MGAEWWYNGCMTTTKKSVDYIANKTSARKKRQDRIDWIDRTTAKLAAEKKELITEVNRDTRALGQLQTLSVQKDALTELIPKLEERLVSATGEDARKILDDMLTARTELESVSEQMRQVYYAR